MTKIRIFDLIVDNEVTNIPPYYGGIPSLLPGRGVQVWFKYEFEFEFEFKYCQNLQNIGLSGPSMGISLSIMPNSVSVRPRTSHELASDV